MLRPVETQARNGFPSGEIEGMRAPWTAIASLRRNRTQHKNRACDSFTSEDSARKMNPGYDLRHELPFLGEYVARRVTIVVASQ
jgi:hypothetical protein